MAVRDTAQEITLMSTAIDQVPSLGSRQYHRPVTEAMKDNITGIHQLLPKPSLKLLHNLKAEVPLHHMGMSN